MPSYLQPLQQPNRHKVPASQWQRWPDVAQRVFNETYAVLKANKTLYMHPMAAVPVDEYWKTTVWNAAWTAADAVVNSLDDIIDGKGYARARKK